MYDREYKKAIKLLRRGSVLKPPKGAKGRLLARLSDRQAGIGSDSALSILKFRESRFVSQFKYALIAALLAIGIINIGYLKAGRAEVSGNWENSIQSYRVIGEFIMDTQIAREFSHAVMMLNRERGETDEI